MTTHPDDSSERFDDQSSSAAEKRKQSRDTYEPMDQLAASAECWLQALRGATHRRLAMVCFHQGVHALMRASCLRTKDQATLRHCLSLIARFRKYIDQNFRGEEVEGVENESVVLRNALNMAEERLRRIVLHPPEQKRTMPARHLDRIDPDDKCDPKHPAILAYMRKHTSSLADYPTIRSAIITIDTNKMMNAYAALSQVFEEASPNRKVKKAVCNHVRESGRITDEQRRALLKDPSLK